MTAAGSAGTAAGAGRAAPGRTAVIAAWVDGEPVGGRGGRGRGGPAARPARSPTGCRPPAPPTARQLRRWVTQRVVLGRLLEHEAAARGRTTPSTVRPDAALVGTAAADVLATSAAARAVLATFATRPTEAEVRAHYAAHPDRYARGERWLARQAFAPTPDALVARAAGRARPGDAGPGAARPSDRPGPQWTRLAPAGRRRGPARPARSRTSRCGRRSRPS